MNASQPVNGRLPPTKRDGGKVWDDEIKIETFLLRLPDSQLKTRLLVRVDTLKKWTDFRGEVVAISRHSPDTTDADGHRSYEQRESEQGKQKGEKKEANEAVKQSKRVQDAGAQITRQGTALTSTRRAASAERSATLRTRVDLLAQRSRTITSMRWTIRSAARRPPWQVQSDATLTLAA